MTGAADSGKNAASFDALSPELALEAVEYAYGLELEGSFEVLPSYVNRVYGLTDASGRRFVAKFYRPGRWSDEAILEEHRFVAQCAAARLPVVQPIATIDGPTLASVEFDTDFDAHDPAFAENPKDAALHDTEPGTLRFALYPRVPGRGFDPETEDDWLALGRIVGALHAATANFESPHRVRMDSKLAQAHATFIEPLVHPELRHEFADLCAKAIELGAPTLSSLRMRTIHGDLHRGNLLAAGFTGSERAPRLTMLDFDDLSTGPAIQDLWLLLPGRSDDCLRELALLAEGYSEHASLDREELRAVETLRFYRLLHYLAWEAIQRDDDRFTRDHPDWGSRAFWIKEIEDIQDQARFLSDQD